MRRHELVCVHGVGHSGGVHGCDGCCGLIGIPAQDKERERIIKLIEHEQSVIDKAGGATFGKRRDYDEGYNVALRDIAILIKGEEQ